LFAYIVSEGPMPEVRDLRRFIAARLPDYMVPSSFVSIDALPLTPNGKVDRQALGLYNGKNALKVDSYVAPTSPRELELAEICAAVLGLDRVGITTSLFDLGADSLQMLQVVARAREAGINLNLRQILLHRKLSSICAEIEKAGEPMSDSGLPPLVPVSREQYRSRAAMLP
jgi:acyl carrier protein